MPDSPRSPELHDPYVALRDPGFLRYLGGFTLAATGLNMLATAVGWEIYERTNDPIHLGYVGLARALPVVALALAGGHAADVYSRKWIVVISQIGFAAAAAGLAFASHAAAPIWAMYSLLVLMGCCRAFNGPARGSLLPTIVKREDFTNAATWVAGAFQFAALAGPLAAGAMIKYSESAAPAFACAAVGNLAFAAMVAGIKPREQNRANGNRSWGAMLDGMGHLWREKTILGAISLDLFAVLLGGATALLPIYAKDILKVDAFHLGVLRAAPFAGALLTAGALAHLPPFKRAGAALLWSVAAFGAATIVFGVSTNFYVSVAALFALGAVDNISVVIRHVLVQVRTPDELRGRVSAVNSVFIECSNELGAYESGLVATYFGPVVSVVSGGVGTIIVVAVTAAALPQLRRLRELHDTPKNEPEEDRRTV